MSPAFLRDNLEENKERAPKIVEVVKRVGCFAGSKNFPFKRFAFILHDAVFQEEDVATVVVAALQPTNKEIQPIDGEWDEQA